MPPNIPKLVRELRALADHLEGGMPSLDGTAANAATFIDAHNGATGQEISEALKISFEHFRRDIVPKLKAHGYHNIRGGWGYWPRGKGPAGRM